MFDRFTSRADQVLFYARAQVSQLGSSAVEPEHILLGLLDEGKGSGSRILTRVITRERRETPTLVVRKDTETPE